MSVELSIDNAAYADLVALAIRGIPNASRGNWTLHAPVDPGITLVELFAWLLEMRSYWADRATPPLVRALLRMLGTDLVDARAARVALSFAGNAQVPAGTEVRLRDGDLVVTLDTDLTSLDVAALHLGDVPGYHDADLRTGRPIPLLAAPAGAVSARIGLELATPPPATAALPVSILFEVDTAVAPQWDPDAVAAQPPAVLAWTYQAGATTWKPLPALDDGTLGLRRSGVVRFSLPADWFADGATRWLRVATASSTFATPPTVLQIVPNTGLATNLARFTETSSPGWLELLPRRTVQLAQPDPLPDGMTVMVAEHASTGDGPQAWTVVPDFTQSGPTDRHVTVDRTRARVSFGDGLAGRIPRLAPGAIPQITVSYASGGGSAGNIPIASWDALDGPLAAAQSWVPAIGGRDPETLDDARARVATALVAPTRAVTPDDHATIAVATKGVEIGRAHAEVGFALGDCGVVPGVTTVFVVPGARSRTADAVRAGTAVVALVPDPGMLAAVTASLEATRLVGEIVRVVPASYSHVALLVTVTGAPYDPAGVRSRVAGALRVYLDALLGGDDTAHPGWPFGDPIRPTALVAVAQRALGDRGDVVSVAVNGESCLDVAIEPYALVAVDSVDVDIELAPAQEAGLR